MNGMPAVSVERCSVRELHRAAKFVTLGTRRNVDADPSFQQAGNLALQCANLRDRASLLVLAYARLPSKSKSMNDHASIVAKIP
jgi:hypothetical protein